MNVLVEEKETNRHRRRSSVSGCEVICSWFASVLVVCLFSLVLMLLLQWKYELEESKQEGCVIPVLGSPVMASVVNRPPFVFVTWEIKEDHQKMYNCTTSELVTISMMLVPSTIYVNQMRTRCRLFSDTFEDQMKRINYGWFFVVFMGSVSISVIGATFLLTRQYLCKDVHHQTNENENGNQEVELTFVSSSSINPESYVEQDRQ